MLDWKRLDNEQPKEERHYIVYAPDDYTDFPYYFLSWDKEQQAFSMKPTAKYWADMHPPEEASQRSEGKPMIKLTVNGNSWPVDKVESVRIDVHDDDIQSGKVAMTPHRDVDSGVTTILVKAYDAPFRITEAMQNAIEQARKENQCP